LSPNEDYVNVISRTVRRLYGSSVVAMTLSRDRGVPYLPRPQLEALRDRRIRRIVAYAAQHVPYYRELFAREGIDPQSTQGAADLDRLPLLDRERRTVPPWTEPACKSRSLKRHRRQSAPLLPAACCMLRAQTCSSSPEIGAGGCGVNSGIFETPDFADDADGDS
jgi:hypothetical protein